MKKVFLSLLLLLGLGTLSAQGNLQFNQIVFYDLASGGVQNFSVPAGKVWKIESVGAGQSSSPMIYLRNATNTNIGYFASNSTASSVYPCWLSTGFVGSFQNVAAVRGYVSIIEFNIVP